MTNYEMIEALSAAPQTKNRRTRDAYPNCDLTWDEIDCVDATIPETQLLCWREGRTLVIFDTMSGECDYL